MVASYVLPFRAVHPPPREFTDYVNWLTEWVEVVLVDGSAEFVYEAVDICCVDAVRHIRPAPDLAHWSNGKVRGVLTGLRDASHDRVILADDDIRYNADNLTDVIGALNTADVVRPQNYFDPLPWHARLDTARTLINRMTGGDWPGTLAVRRSTLERVGGYDGDVLFENLELVRTVEAAGGASLCRPDLFVRRLPPTTQHYASQRVRQAYDEFARPIRLMIALTALPLMMVMAATQHWWLVVGAFVLAPIMVAEAGRQRARGLHVFPISASLCAPLWIVERAVCAWAALIARVAFGGIRYGGRLVVTAAHSSRTLARRHAQHDIRNA